MSNEEQTYERLYGKELKKNQDSDVHGSLKSDQLSTSLNSKSIVVRASCPRLVYLIATKSAVTGLTQGH